MATERSSPVILRRHKRALIGVGAVLVLLIILGRLAALYADYLWFDALGYRGVYTTELWTKVALAVGAFVLTAAWVAGNVALATRLSPGHHFQIRGVKWTLSASKIRRWVTLAGLAFGVIVGLGFAGDAGARWYDVLRFLHRSPFGWTDPVLKANAQVYVFVLPVVAGIKSYVIAMTVFGGIGAAAAYFLNGAIGWKFARMTRAATVHLAALVAVALLAVAFGYWLDRYELLLGPGGAAFGAGYVDAHVRMPALVFMAGLSVAAAAAALAAGILMKPRIAGGAIVVLVAAHVITVWMYPGVRQRFDVDPNELVRETPFIAHNIEATRFAFGLADVQEQEFPAEGTVTPADLRAARGTVDNIRLWDYRALSETYNEIQGLRTYYRFNIVDTDRYNVGSDYRQVSLAVRELEQAALQENSRTWVNLHLLYTHGYGLCMSPVNAVTGSGMPELWVRDLPPVSTVPIEVTEPAIYFGELTRDYVFVRTKQQEFHYPLKDKNVYIHYPGTGGVAVGSWLRRLLFAYHFGDWNVVLADSFTPETRVLWRRQLQERVRRIAPFLEFDDDPYPVVADGRIVWIIDAYTKTDRFPYATPARFGRYGGRINYLRNSVKVTVDAVDGTVRFYIVDPADTLVQVARRIFPNLFRDLDEMPEPLRAHLRYPIDLLDVQATQYFTYHMTDPRVFYNREDLWERPREQYRQGMQPVKAYYIIMTLPGEEKPEYLLMLPVTPSRKNNMIAWMAGRCDGEHYGKLLVYKFPKDRLVLGPQQIEANIDKSDAISEQITLWDQAGSRVIRGNLLVIPIRDSILYAEPLYLESEQTRFPELKRVIVATKDRVVMRRTLREALDAVVAGETSPVTEEEAPPQRPQPVAADAARKALEIFQEAQQHLKDGDWAGYGEAMRRLQGLLEGMSGDPGDP